MAVWIVWPKRPALTVYCAHDSVHAEKILDAFRKENGIRMHIKFDTESTKSLGLVEQLLREKDAPRCDVFWNNEVLGTMLLQSEGVLEPYQSPEATAIPAQYKDARHHWTGFGARLRVYMVDTDRLQPNLDAINVRLGEPDLSGVSIAKPLYGTTRTHYTALWHLLGADKLKAWHQSLHDRQIMEVSGNAITKYTVAERICDLGFTDTDDFFVARRTNSRVAMVPARLPNNQVICIPNTVALIRGGQRPDEARRLIDYLLSSETQLALAKGNARQIPLGKVDASVLPEEVKNLLPLVNEGINLTELKDSSKACLAWLKSLYLGG